MIALCVAARHGQSPGPTSGETVDRFAPWWSKMRTFKIDRKTLHRVVTSVCKWESKPCSPGCTRVHSCVTPSRQSRCASVCISGAASLTFDRKKSIKKGCFQETWRTGIAKHRLVLLQDSCWPEWQCV